jgi:effector-binding domain-containing protein
MIEWMSEHNLVPSDEMWEFYLTDPADQPDPQKWETKVVWPVVPVTV